MKNRYHSNPLHHPSQICMQVQRSTHRNARREAGDIVRCCGEVKYRAAGIRVCTVLVAPNTLAIFKLSLFAGERIWTRWCGFAYCIIDVKMSAPSPLTHPSVLINSDKFRVRLVLELLLFSCTSLNSAKGLELEKPLPSE